MKKELPVGFQWLVEPVGSRAVCIVTNFHNSSAALSKQIQLWRAKLALKRPLTTNSFGRGLKIVVAHEDQPQKRRAFCIEKVSGFSGRWSQAAMQQSFTMKGKPNVTWQERGWLWLSWGQLATGTTKTQRDFVLSSKHSSTRSLKNGLIY